MSTPLPRPRSTADRPRGRVDVVALVFGLVLTGIAATALWTTAAGPIDWSIMSTAAPLALVVIGVVGLLLSRRRP